MEDVLALIQGQNSRSNLSSYHFDHGSNANDLGLVPHNVVPGNASEHDGHISMGWIGQFNSGGNSWNQVSLEELHVQDGLLSSAGINSGTSQRLEERDYEPNRVAILGSVNESFSNGLVVHGASTLQGVRSDAINQNVALNVVETVEEMGDRSGPSSDGQSLSCKRKAPEEASGELPIGENSSSTQQAEYPYGQAIPTPGNASMCLNTRTPSNDLPNATQPEQANPIPGFGMVGFDSNVHQTSSLAGNVESLRRNIRLRRGPANQQDSPTASITLFGTSVINPHVQSSNQSSGVSLLNHSSELRPVAAAASSISPVAPLVHVPSNSNSQIMQHCQWDQITSSNSGSVSSISPVTTANGSDALQEGESLQHVPGHTSQQSIIISESEIVDLEPNPTNLINSPSIFASSSQLGSRADVQLSDPAGLPQQNIVEGAQNGSIAGRHLSSAPLGTPPQNITEGHAHGSSGILRQSTRGPVITWRDVRAARYGDPRAMMALLTPGLHMTRAERYNAIASGVYHQIRPSAAFSRAVVAYEFRRVLTLIHSSDNLEYEDDMLVDESLLSPQPPVEMLYDTHEDMRLEIDDMSYEDLLDLEEQIGDVNTGLSEEDILAGMQRHKYQPIKFREQESCCICLDEYLIGEELGKLDCVHRFHFDCIKQWLLLKNSCPICKLTALAVGEEE